MAIRLLFLFLDDNSLRQGRNLLKSTAPADRLNLRALITHGLEPFQITKVQIVSKTLLEILSVPCQAVARRNGLVSAVNS